MQYLTRLTKHDKIINFQYCYVIHVELIKDGGFFHVLFNAVEFRDSLLNSLG